MKDSLSTQQARKLVLLSQRVPPSKPAGTAEQATLSAIEHLGYVQIDTISVIQRAHHHTLWNRNPRYKAKQLDALLDAKTVFEYWSHAAAYMPMRDFRYSLPRKHALQNGELSHWFKRDEPMIRMVMKRIHQEGPLMAADFDNSGKKVEEWNAKPAKRALEYLFMQGDLMVPRRINFHKVYDLTERVLPPSIDTTLPEPEDYARHLITRYLDANGLGQPTEIAYLRKGVKPLVVDVLQDMVSTGEVMQVRVNGEVFYAIPSTLERLSQPLARRKLKILSPFDNLVIQRKRMQVLFDFDYLIECYVPQAKRRYGYFSLPILWDGRLVARMDCKAERKESRLDIQHFVLEPFVTETESLFQALGRELSSFLRFNECDHVRLHRTSPRKIKQPLKSALGAFL